MPNDGSAPRVFGPAFGASQTGAPLVDFVANCTSDAHGFVVYGAVEYVVDEGDRLLSLPGDGAAGDRPKSILRLSAATEGARGRWVHDLRCAAALDASRDALADVSIVASGDGLRTARAGVAARFSVSASDRFGAVRRLGVSGGTVDEAAAGTSSLVCLSAIFESESLMYDLSESAEQLDDGSCRFTYRAQRAGAYTLSVRFGRDGEHVPGSPWHIAVESPRAVARNSTAGGSGLQRAVGTAMNSFTVGFILPLHVTRIVLTV